MNALKQRGIHSQLAIQAALLTRTEHTQINTDYEKLFDTFDPLFFFFLLLCGNDFALA